MPVKKCFECRKRVSQINSRFARDPKATGRDNYTIPGERIYGPDCFEKLIASGAIVEREEGGYRIA